MTDAVSAGLLILRIGLGIVFLAHGIKHVLSRAKTTAWFAWLGFRAPGMQWFASTMTEIGAGALMALGLLTAPAAAGMIGVMFVAFWTVHRPAGFFITAFMREGVDVEGYEYVLTLAIAALALAVSGPGSFALDGHITIGDVTIASMLDGWAGFAVALIGVVGGVALLATFWRPSTRNA